MWERSHVSLWNSPKGQNIWTLKRRIKCTNWQTNLINISSARQTHKHTQQSCQCVVPPLWHSRSPNTLSLSNQSSEQFSDRQCVKLPLFRSQRRMSAISPAAGALWLGHCCDWQCLLSNRLLTANEGGMSWTVIDRSKEGWRLGFDMSSVIKIYIFMYNWWKWTLTVLACLFFKATSL